MPKYKVTHKNGGTATITADKYETDGAGTRFLDAQNKLIASFYDGEIRGVVPEDVVFEEPAPAPEVIEDPAPEDPAPTDPAPEGDEASGD